MTARTSHTRRNDDDRPTETSPMAKKPKNGAVREGAREPTAEEQAAIKSAAERYPSRPLRPRVSAKVTETSVGKQVELGAPHSDRAGWHITLNDALATRSHAFTDQAMTGVANVLDPNAKRPEAAYNAALALIGGINPQNELEAALACQIVATHGLSMDCMGRAARESRMDARDTFVSQATKLSRTMTAQIEALTKLRSGGKQQVEVRYVYVDARNSQNLIGIGTGGAQGDGGQPAIQTQPNVPGLAFAPGLPMRCEDASGHALPAASDAREEALPKAWGEEPRRAEGRTQRSLQERPAHERDEGAPARRGGDSA